MLSGPNGQQGAIPFTLYFLIEGIRDFSKAQHKKMMGLIRHFMWELLLQPFKSTT